MIRIGNQTAFSAASPTEPFEYALANGFDAFEWFPDMNNGVGWDDSNLDGPQRDSIRKTAEDRGIRLSVHARWQANPLNPDSPRILAKDFELAQDLGAALFNLHLYHESGVQAYIKAITPLIELTAKAHLQLSLENTPDHTPEHFNELFARLAELKKTPTSHVGMCFDLGHANLSAATRNDYLRFLDHLRPNVPIIHLHLHENWGDSDTHLPLFTGPAGRDDSGIRGFLKRLQKRAVSGSMIFEQWPNPPVLLNNARDRLLALLNAQNTELPHSVAKAGSPPASNRRGAAVSPLRLDGREGRAEGPASYPKNQTTPGLGSPLPTEGTEARDEGPAGSPKSQKTPATVSPLLSDRKGVMDLGTFTEALLAADKRARSWREKLDSLRVLLSRDNGPLTTEQLVDTAIYLRFLSTGQIQCLEDGRHFRPGHHARIALDISTRLAVTPDPQLDWLLRKILPSLPSTAEPFRRAEPLTRIRDIAHRNDIPSELKRELKHSLQNKLHRCAGPEDLATSAEFLKRFTAPGADYPPTFVDEFKLFHKELKEFFNASSLQDRLTTLQSKAGPEQVRLISNFLAHSDAEDALGQLDALGSLAELRQSLLETVKEKPGVETQEFLLADIALEEFAFALVSTLLNSLELDFVDAPQPDWSPALALFSLTTRNLALSGVAAEEAEALLSELTAWSKDFNSNERDQLLRLKASTERGRRFAEKFSESILALFTQRAESLGHALGIPHHAVRVFAEAEIRSHLVFQLSKLASLLLHRIRGQLGLPTWDVLVSGHAVGRLKAVDSLDRLNQETPEPVIGLVQKAQGDEEIPKSVAGVVLGHELPHLSHLGVRARQGKVVFVASEEAAAFAKFSELNGKLVSLSATTENVEWKLAPTASAVKSRASSEAVRIPAVRLRPERVWLPIDQVAADNAGDKAVGIRRLAELSRRSGSGFQVPQAMAIPFGVMEASLAAVPELQARYSEMVSRFDAIPAEEASDAARLLRDLLLQLNPPEEIVSAVARKFNQNVRLFVRSSANCEDLEDLAGAGLYESVANVLPEDVPGAVRTVWSSLWSRRAAMSRKQAGIAHEQAHMAVIIQQMIVPDYSFILHTVNPLRHDPGQLYAELAVGLGETLASAADRGTPYRFVCDKQSDTVTTLAFANFSQGFFAASSGVQRKTLDYSRVGLSRDTRLRNMLGRRLATLGTFVENAFGQPQDIEGAVVGEQIYLVQSRPQQGIDNGRI
jgi:phosphoglucan,water dikinase